MRLSVKAIVLECQLAGMEDNAGEDAWQTLVDDIDRLPCPKERSYLFRRMGQHLFQQWQGSRLA